MTFTTRPELVGTFGMVASTHWLASASGMAILERGGNAFDAAVAAGFVLQVVEPHLNGPGGEVPILLHRAATDDVAVLNGQGAAPAAATIERFTDLGLSLVPGTGLLAACVPGAFDAWMTLLAEHGTMRVADVLEHAIGYAEHGYPLAPRVSATIGGVTELFTTHWPSSAEVYLRAGVPAPGSRFTNPDLARTYRRVVTEAEAAGADRDAQIGAARDAFYRGFVAEAVDAYLAGAEVIDTSGRRHRGLLTGADLAGHTTPTEQPVTGDYAGWRVFKTGPWGQGPVFLQQLALLSGFDLRAAGHNSADYIATVTECAKLAFADREAWYGDPAFTDVPLDELLSAPYADRRRALVGPEASRELRPGAMAGREPRLPPLPADTGAGDVLGAGEPTIERAARGPEAGPVDGDTCHVDVADRFGNLVSATPSGGWLQSSPVVPGLGFCLGTRAQMFWLTPGLANSLEPRKRPRTTLSPSLARSDDRILAFGTPGGDQQDQWTLQFFLAHTHFGMDLQAAIDAPTFHTTSFPSSFYPRRTEPGQVVVEGRVPASVIAALRARGHDVVVEGDWSLGRVSAAARDAGSGFLRAAANPRGMQGYAVGR